MKLQYIFCWLLITTGTLGTTTAQTWVKGTIKDSKGEVIIGANIYLEDTYDGTSSDVEGNFSFSTSETGEQLLKATYLGYADFTKTVQVSGDSLTLEIKMKINAMELQDVVITAGAYDAGGANKQEVMKPLDILTTAGATGDIAGALNTLPGTQAVGESGRLFVRGGEGYETKTFVDGMQVMNFYSVSAPNTPGRSRFMPYMFSGVSFSTGGYSAEYGQALSSALVMNSKFLATQNRMDVSLMSVGGDIGITRSWENSSLAAKAQYTNLDPYMNLINQEIDWIDAPTSGEASISYRSKLSSSGVFKFFGNFNRSGLALNRYELHDPTTNIRTRLDNQYLYLNGVVQDEIGGGWNLKAGLSYTDSQDDIGLDVAKVNENEWGIHTKLVIGKTLNNNVSFRTGLDYFNRRFKQGYNHPDVEADWNFGFREQIGALFAESDIYLSTALLARVGVRAEYTGLNDQIDVAPRLSLAWKTAKHSQVSMAYGRFQQAAQRQWLAIVPDLQNERADHYILNYQINRSHRTFRIELFHKEYQDLVKFNDPTTALSFNNNGRGYARGLDLFWRDGKSLRNTDYWVSYSYTDTKRDYRDYVAEVRPSFSSAHNFSLVVKHFVNSIKSQLGVTYRMASGRPYHNPNQSGFMTEKTPTYHDLSANISYLFKQNIIIHMSATNLLGLDQVFGYEFASQPDAAGYFSSRAIRPPAKRFLFLGVFITLSKEKVLNQLPTL
ncbi:MAG: TonB-dependent receptor [Saprospiraceae bacterium]|nr:TonB-dependent receptor [Saprospiraceae bacterium]